jgi:hypothetical protein
MTSQLPWWVIAAQITMVALDTLLISCPRWHDHKCRSLRWLKR